MGYIAGALSVPIVFFCLWFFCMIYEVIVNGFEALTKKYLWHDLTELIWSLFLGSLGLILFIGLSVIFSMLIFNFIKTI